MSRLPLLTVALVALPSLAFAAGSGPTTPTQTTKQCTGSQVYDAATKACVDSRDSSMNDTLRLDAARELAAFDRADDALAILANLENAETPEALTLRGFATRKAGDFETAMTFYDAALAIDPDYILARSYMGQGLAEKGQTEAARTQLALIRQAGGRGTWAETSLARAIETGRGYGQ
ncbi:hypothetical protein JANAI62_27560 [Jannaschia pagri]|uniref:Tetratricopeptide repeat-containing protein n=1 Tax=Jannaschia pagri TaxID=2829797 RepID=A0ABQ4NNZ2_9RHOB|nr:MULTISPECIES: tetratricopeptide repeat protein [unclassified Jannaschia]GIT92298.1 hypothetical protein JANAI61_27560 [Jannaschia sp. AI_61]GIT96133.1 hypothetical protein JANAI62_27560 [Jannaschia sp. AI_62]